jgi:DNA-binding transcriptional LysR family regulator
LAPRVKLVAARIDERTGQALQSGEADLALGYTPWLEAGFYQQALYAEDWVCLANARHPQIRKTLTRRLYEAVGHVGITGGTGSELLANAVKRERIRRKVMLELPGFLGLGAIVASTDLIATLPRQIGEALAASAGLAVHASPIAIAPFTVQQHWHARAHHDGANRWLRNVCEGLFQRRRQSGARLG